VAIIRQTYALRDEPKAPVKTSHNRRSGTLGTGLKLSTVSHTMPTLSVVIPTLNEEARIAETIANVRIRLPEAEIIIADGGSVDETIRISASTGTRIVHSLRGRGVQCNSGAGAATGNVLFFLHADCLLPANASEVLAAYFSRPEVLIGTFRLVFDDRHPFLRVCSWFARFDSVFTRFGDQGIVMRRDFYAALGGFPNWLLFEDVELLRRARRETRIWSLPAEVTTSARRFRRYGPVRQQVRNGGLLLRFLLGTSPDELAREYTGEPIGTSTSNPKNLQ
jgi:rSAM/selenodomain-associated transferase 2